MLVVAVSVLLALMLVAIPVAVALIMVAYTLGWGFSDFAFYQAIGAVLWSNSNNYTLLAIPLFILIGELLVRCGSASKAYSVMEAWLSWLPGGLIHANIGASVLFSATTGSSVATAATISTIALPEGRRLDYNEGIFCGAIAAGGTLGILIPPSISLIIYGVLTETSIPKLFAAGLVPGLLLAICFSAVTCLLVIVKPTLVGNKTRKYSWKERLLGMLHLTPMILLFVVMVGSIYTGIATPTEAAAAGLVATLIIAFSSRRFRLKQLVEALLSSFKTTGMIMLIVLASYCLNYVLSIIGISDRIEMLFSDLDVSPMTTLLIVALVYLLLGFFIETLSLMVLTLPMLAPIVFAQGFDKVWFGIVVILLIEMALITPPVGLNLYVVQSTRNRGSIIEVIYGAIPYIFAMLLMLILLIIFPSIALFLPGRM
ncbi:TRAP transporter large permease [Pusillimonas sp. ANT_WB101]|uniref:TRAP transporter large permease n=1 Tax=Pusillimonas sp. ANT_WB101 TaxID=2597356 RepID=UPI0011EBD907|nr:TRAP transporter large permease subunit [Pusillimonas sp. ANT_WB101]KAA0892562.1 TRAP transporter large permease subunit [Pusillimonas sp. ANT_WB101]